MVQPEQYTYRTEHQDGKFFSMVYTYRGWSWAEAWDRDRTVIAKTRDYRHVTQQETAHHEICRMVAEFA